ncbi:hypothetical protein ACROYT_G035595 [Oculina patagonica]
MNGLGEVHWARSGQTKKNPAPLPVLLSRRLFDLKRKLSNRFVKERYEKSSYVTNRNVWNSYWTQVKKEVYCRVGDAVQGRYNDGEPGWDNVGIRLVPSLGIGEKVKLDPKTFPPLLGGKKGRAGLEVAMILAREPVMNNQHIEDWFLEW